MSAANDNRGTRAYLGQGCMALVCAALLVCGMGSGTASAARWRIQRTPTTGIQHGDLASVSCTSRTACTAVGSSFTDDPQVTVPLVERWNGAAWSIQPTPPKPATGLLFAVSCTSAAACTAVGKIDTSSGDTLPLAEDWNGARWSIQRVPRPFVDGSLDDATLDAVSCTSKVACIAVGQDDTSDQPLAERWNGSTWSIQRTPSPSVNGGGLVAVSCRSKTTCTAVGSFGTGDCSVPLVERWNGSRWSLQSSPALPACGSLDDSGFNGVSCLSRTICTAVGNYDSNTPGDGYDFPLAERASGGVWRIQSSPSVNYLIDPWGGGGTLVDVTCPSAVACISVGVAGSELRRLPLIERWTGTHWEVHLGAGGMLDGGLVGISCTSEMTCTAVGFNDSVGAGSDVPLVERLS